MKEPTPPPLPAAATVAMEEEEEDEGGGLSEQHLLTGDHERELSPAVAPACGEEESEEAVAGVAAVAMLSVEVVVDEVEPHIVQVAYSQVCARRSSLHLHLWYHLFQTDSYYDAIHCRV